MVISFSKRYSSPQSPSGRRRLLTPGGDSIASSLDGTVGWRGSAAAGLDDAREAPREPTTCTVPVSRSWWDAVYFCDVALDAADLPVDDAAAGVCFRFARPPPPVSDRAKPRASFVGGGRCRDG